MEEVPPAIPVKTEIESLMNAFWMPSYNRGHEDLGSRDKSRSLNSKSVYQPQDAKQILLKLDRTLETCVTYHRAFELLGPLCTTTAFLHSRAFFRRKRCLRNLILLL